jgi:serine/threonine-protein kinase
MSDKKDMEGKTPPEEERTVYMPTPGQAPSPPAGDPPAGGEDRTVYMPPPGGAPAAGGGPPADADRTVYMPPSEAAPPQATVVAPTSLGANFAPRTDSRAIQVGDVLNHIFEVKRFIARGGMGEVFEGVNVNTDERVAIKVMLPALAADANVIAMFRKEARTLTRLQHEALVQYRVLAQEPQLGVLYIVTEYIDGVNLADVLGKTKPTPAELKQLLAKLAAGLKVAHALGAVHRDMSPDNVLLDGGKLEGAKIIDFGIAKDLDPSSKTIIGEGFAGKLNYVAPEQLGDFNREVGPWTDVYSLALVILAVAMGKNVQMGGSLVDAVDKRRTGPDLSGAPEELRPVLTKMLKANPKERLRSMDEVLKELGHGAYVPGAGGAPPPAGVSKGVLIGGGLAAAAAIGAIAWLALDRGPTPEEQVQIARVAINQTLPSVPCSWLGVEDVQSGEQTSVRMNGVAGSPGEAQSRISRALTGAGLERAAINFGDVALIRPAGCSALETYGKIRQTGAPQLSVTKREFEREAQPEGPPQALAELTVKVPGDKNFSLLGIEPNGNIDVILADRAAFDEAVAADVVSKDSAGAYKVPFLMDHVGWSGLILLTGDAPFEPAVVEPDVNARGPDWQSNFVATASERDWKAEMLWIRSVDKVPN